MHITAFTSYIDLAQLTLYVFWIFFAGLILYLRGEDKREGYPLESDRSGSIQVEGFPGLPPPKVFLLPHGGTVTVPRLGTEREILAQPVATWPGAPLRPTGNPMADGVGPASYALRADSPELTIDGHPAIVPMRVVAGATIDPEDPDPRGMAVMGADGLKAGTITDVWIDLTEPQIRYLEVELTSARHVLLPITLAEIVGSRHQVNVSSVLAAQFDEVPPLRIWDQVTKREEDQITAYYASGKLYAKPSRLGPFL
jgi:photosynthetic reaction center H subunit